MFDVYCPGHRARILLGSRSIDALVNTPDGIELHWTCRCGTHGVLRPARGDGAAIDRRAIQAAA